jgi:hypothetical protein
LSTLEPDSTEGQQLKRERDRLQRYLRELTPLIKYYASEKCVEITRAALQVHGGYGVITDYDAERFYRDAVVFPIYEGTSQIQALMALKDTMKDVMSNPSAVFKRMLRSYVRRLTASEPLERKLASAEWQLYSSIAYVLRQVMSDAVKASGQSAMSRGLLAAVKETIQENPDVLTSAKRHAERLTIIRALIHISRILLREAALSDERRGMAERFITRMEPLVKLHATYIKRGAD